MPCFCVVVPAYDAESTLAGTLDAISAQTFSDWECIIVDDGSADGTSAVALGFTHRDSRFRLITQTNQGTAGAYNTGVQAASASLVVLCSADDLLLPKHLSVMDDLIDRNPGCGIYSCNGDYLFVSGRRASVYSTHEWEHEKSLSFGEVLACCFFSVGATYKKSVFDLVGGYRVGVYGEDYDFWLRAMAVGVRHRYTPHVLSLHRISGRQKSASVLRVYHSNIEVYKNLIDGEWVRPIQVPLVESAIISRRNLIKKVRRRQLLLERSENARVWLTRVLGRRMANGSTRLLASACAQLRAWKHRRWK